MKKAAILIAGCLFLLACLPGFAQAQSPASPYPTSAYYKILHLERVWVHQLGYVVSFFSSQAQLQYIYLPVGWFNKGPASKAELIYSTGEPYVTIFWIDGKFDHVNLHVPRNPHDQVWGIADPAIDLTAKFNVQDVPLSF